MVIIMVIIVGLYCYIIVIVYGIIMGQTIYQLVIRISQPSTVEFLGTPVSLNFRKNNLSESEFP